MSQTIAQAAFSLPTVEEICRFANFHSLQEFSPSALQSYRSWEFSDGSQLLLDCEGEFSTLTQRLEAVTPTTAATPISPTVIADTLVCLAPEATVITGQWVTLPCGYEFAFTLGADGVVYGSLRDEAGGFILDTPTPYAPHR